MQRWLEETRIVDFSHPDIQRLIAERRWLELEPYRRLGAVYTYVKDEVPFGYNRSDDLPASEVLADGYGQCNTKGNLLVALLRAAGIPARFHGFTIDKELQRGAIPSWLFSLAPDRILHSWVEAQWKGTWVELEGFILDDAYLSALQSRFPHAQEFCGYGAATPNLQNPGTSWCGRSTYIQRDGIVDDFGAYDDPDGLYADHGTNLSGLRRLLYTHVVRHIMNANIQRIRGSVLAAARPRYVT